MKTRFCLTLVISAYFLINIPLLQAQQFGSNNRVDFNQDNYSESFDSKIAELQQRYPNAEIRIVTPKQLQIIRQENKFFLAEVSDSSEEKNHSPEQKTVSKKEVSSEQGGFLDLPSLPDFGNIDSDAAVIIFVLIGVVVTVVLVAYTAKFFYDVLNKEDLQFWWSINTHSNALLSSQDDGYFNGIKISSGLVDEKVDIGASIDVGRINADLRLRDGNIHHVEGAYVMAGPSIRAYSYEGEDSSYFAFDILVGKVDYEEDNLLSYAKGAYNFPIGKNFRMGISIGSVYLDLDKDKNLVREGKSFNLTGGVELGYKF